MPAEYSARASARPRVGSNAQNCQLWPRCGLSPAAAMNDLRGAHTLAAALPRPMYRITCPSRADLHARSQVLAMRCGLMCWITGHYPMALRTDRRLTMMLP